MDQKEIKALISLIDDDDTDVSLHITEKILSLGEDVIPFLKNHQQTVTDSFLQEKINDIIYTIQIESTQHKLSLWKEMYQDDLLYGFWAVASYRHPDLSLQMLRDEIEQLYQICKGSIKASSPTDSIKALNNIFFGMLGFQPDKKDFHNPSNSYLNEVIQNKKGNPLSLSVIYLLIARKLNLPVYGVNLPNIFILSYLSDTLQFYINVFNRGLVFSKKDIDNYLSQLNVQASKRFYDPCSHTQIIIRHLKNLALSYEVAKQNQSKRDIMNLLKILES